MLLRHAVHEAAVVQRQVGHVQDAVEAELDGAPVVRAVVVGQHLAQQRQRKLVVAGRHRRVRREDTQRLDRERDLACRLAHAAALHFFEAQFEHQQRRVALVHVEAPDVVVTQRAQHTHAADAENDFLAQPVAVVTAVQGVGEVAVGLRVFGQVAVEQQHRHRGPGDALDFEAPRAKLHVAPFDAHRHACRHLDQRVGRCPRLRGLGLRTVAGQALLEVALPMHERHRDHRQFGVGRRTHRVARQHAQAAAVRWNRFGQADLH